MIYLDEAVGMVALDTINQTTVPVAVYNNTTGGVFSNSPIVLYPGHTEWIYYHDYENVVSEVSSDGNDLKRPTPIVDDTLYIFHYNTLVAVRGTIQ